MKLNVNIYSLMLLGVAATQDVVASSHSSRVGSPSGKGVGGSHIPIEVFKVHELHTCPFITGRGA